MGGYSLLMQKIPSAVVKRRTIMYNSKTEFKESVESYMNWTDLKITVNTKDAEAAAAIAQLAVPYGIYIEDYSDMLELVPEIAHIDLIDEELLARSRTEAILHLYLPPEENPAEAVAFLTHRLEANRIEYRIETDRSLAEEDWANAWKQYYHPTHLGERLVVCPSWEEYSPAEQELVMTLDPGMAFGSGTHHTTRLCCTLLETLPVEGKRVLDMGTGSGILSIGALLLGAEQAVGVDIDSVAVRTAGENAEENGFGADRFIPVTADLVHQTLPEELTHGGFDIVLANIVADVIIALAPSIRRHLRTGGHLVASGIILPRADEVVAALEAEGLTVLERREQEGWCALLLQKS